MIKTDKKIYERFSSIYICILNVMCRFYFFFALKNLMISSILLKCLLRAHITSREYYYYTIHSIENITNDYIKHT